MVTKFKLIKEYQGQITKTPYSSNFLAILNTHESIPQQFPSFVAEFQCSFGIQGTARGTAARANHAQNQHTGNTSNHLPDSHLQSWKFVTSHLYVGDTADSARHPDLASVPIVLDQQQSQTVQNNCKTARITGVTRWGRNTLVKAPDLDDRWPVTGCITFSI